MKFIFSLNENIFFIIFPDKLFNAIIWKYIYVSELAFFNILAIVTDAKRWYASLKHNVIWTSFLLDKLCCLILLYNSFNLLKLISCFCLKILSAFSLNEIDLSIL